MKLRYSFRILGNKLNYYKRSVSGLNSRMNTAKETAGRLNLEVLQNIEETDKEIEDT